MTIIWYEKVHRTTALTLWRDYYANHCLQVQKLTPEPSEHLQNIFMTEGQKLSADEDHVIWSKATTQTLRWGFSLNYKTHLSSSKAMLCSKMDMNTNSALPYIVYLWMWTCSCAFGTYGQFSGDIWSLRDIAELWASPLVDSRWFRVW